MAKVAVLVADDFQDAEVRIPTDRLRGAGHEVHMIGVHAGEKLRGKLGEEEILVDRGLDTASTRDYDALVIPGGGSPAHLREHARAVKFVRDFVDSQKPIAAVCHGPQLLVAAHAVKGKTLTSWPMIRSELERAGAHWVDREVVEDGTLITSRMPDDLEVFSRTINARLAGAPAKLQQRPAPPRSAEGAA